MLALIAAGDPVRLGVILLMVSRPRPMLNLLAYWVGCLIANIPALLVPLMVLHFAPVFKPLIGHTATAAGSTLRHVQVGMGVLALSIAALIAVRSVVRQRAQLPMAGDTPSTLVLPPISRLPGRPPNTSEGGSGIWRLLGHAQDAWESGSLWVALVVGIGSGPPPVEWLLVVTAVVASGAALATQVSAALAFVFGMLAVVEIMLVSYLATPAKTETAMLRVHDWVRAQRGRLVVGVCALLGASLVASGM